MQRIKIFAEGTHRTSSAKKSWNSDDVEKILQASLEKSPEMIPVVPFHPQDNLPVFGYVPKSGLKVELVDGRKVITSDDASVPERFKQFFKNVGLDKVSIKIGKDFSIRHVGLVDDPAVSGLGAAFSADPAPVGDEDVFVFSFSTPEPRDGDGNSQTKTSVVITPEELAKFQNEKAEGEKKLAAVQAEADKAKAEADRLRAEKLQAEEAAEEARFSHEIDSFLSGEAKDRLTPKQLVIFKRLAIATRKNEEIEFSAEDGKKFKSSPLSDLKALILSFGKVQGKEVATQGAAFSGQKPESLHERAYAKFAAMVNSQ